MKNDDAHTYTHLLRYMQIYVCLCVCVFVCVCICMYIYLSLFPHVLSYIHVIHALYTLIYSPRSKRLHQYTSAHIHTNALNDAVDYVPVRNRIHTHISIQIYAHSNTERQACESCSITHIHIFTYKYIRTYTYWLFLESPLLLQIWQKKKRRTLVKCYALFPRLGSKYWNFLTAKVSEIHGPASNSVRYNLYSLNLYLSV